ncbi:MAG: hypothetical protein IPJ71_03860 [Bdellovibrionales bacterium]|nr:hypothetical protein [Bdellovibrionales bacterium]
MKNMKRSLLFVLSAISLILILTQESKARGAGDFFDIIDTIRDHRDGHRPLPPDRPFPGRPGHPADDFDCQVVDRGHEEHYGGHDSCRSCLREHGDCVERCEGSSYRCVAQGHDGRGHFYNSAPGFGSSEREAARDAIFQCRDERLLGCRVVQCNRGRGEVVTRSCGRR